MHACMHDSMPRARARFRRRARVAIDAPLFSRARSTDDETRDARARIARASVVFEQRAALADARPRQHNGSEGRAASA